MTLWDLPQALEKRLVTTSFKEFDLQEYFLRVVQQEPY